MLALDKVLPVAIAVVCVLMLARLFMGERLRGRIDRLAIQSWQGLRRRVLKLVRRRSSRKAAAQATEEVIRRARTKASGEWEGNVYKPDSFKRPRKPH
ncbi:MAG: hypothetical protein EOP40_09360 [Rubrivivax sp.]|nr:MAG: hypothetical protein EOP40_09360 [Rubrivivax sp.]